MHGFEDRDMIADVGRGSKAQTSDQSRAKVRYNITLQIGQYYHIEQIGACNEFHTKVIHNNIIGLKVGILFGYFVEAFQEQPVGNLHNVGLMTTANAFCIFLAGHLEGITHYLHRAGAGNKTAAESHVLRKHVLDTTIGVFDIFANNGNVNGNAGLAKDGIDSVQRGKDAFVGIGIPSLASGYVDTCLLYTSDAADE